MRGLLGSAVITLDRRSPMPGETGTPGVDPTERKMHNTAYG